VEARVSTSIRANAGQALKPTPYTRLYLRRRHLSRAVCVSDLELLGENVVNPCTRNVVIASVVGK
jgi:hypothetical protein